MTSLVPLLILLVAAGTAAGAPCGIVCILADGNSTLDVDHLFSDGVYSWDVDGVEQISERNWFWLRSGVGGSGAPGAEFRLDDEDTNFGSGSGFQLVSSNLVGDSLALRYQGRGLQIDLDWILTGGSPGSTTISLPEPTGNAPLLAGLSLLFFLHALRRRAGVGRLGAAG